MSSFGYPSALHFFPMTVVLLPAVIGGIPGWWPIPSVWPVPGRGAIAWPTIISSPMAVVLIARPAVGTANMVAGKAAIHVRNAASTTVYVAQGGSAPAPIGPAAVGHEPVPVGLDVRTAPQVGSWRDVLSITRCYYCR